METPPQYVTPPSRPVRGVKSGARRARGGARGGRVPRIKAETSDKVTTPSIVTPTAVNTPVVSTPTEVRGSGRGRVRGARVNRGGRPRGSRAGASAGRGPKRKREDDEEKDDSDVSEIITPLPTQSRSGRKITHANNFSPVVIDLEERSKPSAIAKPTTNVTEIIEIAEATIRKGRKRASKVGETSDVIRIEEQEWLCGDCQVLREEKAHVEGKVSAEGLGVAEKRRYLQTLSSRNLVSLLLHATVLHPDLPIFATSSGGPLPERPKRPVTHFVDPTAPAEEEEDDLYPESDPLPYPKAGNGVPIPSESENLALLIDEDVGVYSHVWDWDKRGLDLNAETEREQAHSMTAHA
ncbi:MAG: hypothetical protein Q9223_004454 [Gallowayella weberi]